MFNQQGTLLVAVVSVQLSIVGMTQAGEGVATMVPGTGQLVASGTNGFNGPNINTFLGADRFYNAGLTGSSAVVANVEAGHIWSGHESLTHVSQFIHNTNGATGAGPQSGEFDRHATWVGAAMAGRVTPTFGGEFQRGIAYGATLWSGAIAPSWVGTPYALGFNINTFQNLTVPYGTFFQNGIAGRRADVINSSWGGTDATGNGTLSLVLDGYSRSNPRTTFVASAGNSGSGVNTVGGPGSGFNGITVGALGSDTSSPIYNTVSTFSSRAPQDYSDSVNGLNPSYKGESGRRRAAVDISAPGQNLTLAYYGGTTGGNSASLGTPVGVTNDNFFYSTGIAGTSFAAPIVAGGVGLLADAAYNSFPGNANARDSRVVKSVLLNSADKTAGWNNGQSIVGGVITTRRSLDYEVGAGRMNLDKAFDQYLTGTTDVPGVTGGIVSETGWDFGQVSQNLDTDYLISPLLEGGTDFTATLTWFRDRTFNNTTFATTDTSFDDLDLSLWSVVGGVPTTKIAESISGLNPVEHFHLTLPNDGFYMLRVNWFGEVFDTVSDVNTTTYGLAWSGTVVPEPATMGLLMSAAFGLLARRRRRVG